MKVNFEGFDFERNENGIDFCLCQAPGQWNCMQNVTIKHNVTFNSNCFANKIHIEMFIKFITLFIGLLVIRNERPCVFFSFMHKNFALLRIIIIYTFLRGQFKPIWAGSK